MSSVYMEGGLYLTWLRRTQLVLVCGVCAHELAGVCACTCEVTSQRSMSSLLSVCLTVLRQGLSLNLKLAVDKLTGQHAFRLSLSQSPSVGVKGTHSCSRLSVWLLGILTPVLMLAAEALFFPRVTPSFKNNVFILFWDCSSGWPGNSLCKPGWPLNSQRSTSFCLPRTEIKNMHCHVQPIIMFWQYHVCMKMP